MQQPFEQFHTIHLTGIKGVAMTSLAQMLIDLGKKVEGSDLEEEFVTQHALESLPIQLKVGFDSSNISNDVDLLIFSGAHKGSQNPEVLAAQERGIKTMSHAEALGEIMNSKKGISVCGVGGKSSTSAMISWILSFAKKSNSYSVGVGNVPNLNKTGSFVAEDEWFTAESDEYAVDPIADHRPRFVFQHPSIIVCTNLKYDHPDIYPSFEAIKKVYADFFATLPSDGVLVVNGDDENLAGLVSQYARVEKVSVKKQDGDCYLVSQPDFKRRHTSVRFAYRGTEYSLELQLPGIFNIQNALYAFVTAMTVGVLPEVALKALSQFRGTMRRFEFLGNVVLSLPNGEQKTVDWYDDYAHHPSEIAATLRALREWYPAAQIIAIFQPHTYSRTKALFTEFSQSFGDADVVLIPDIFPSAREALDASITSEMLVEAVKKQGTMIAENPHTLDDVAAALPKYVDREKETVVITIGAGDVYRIKEIFE